MIQLLMFVGGNAMEELEIVPQHQIDGIRIFINRVEYRSPHLH